MSKFIRKLDKAERPRWFGLYREIISPPNAPTFIYIRIPFNVVAKLWWVVISWVRSPFPAYKRQLDVANQLMLQATESLRTIVYYIHEQDKRFSDNKIGTTKYIKNVQKFVPNFLKNAHPEIFNDIYAKKSIDVNIQAAPIKMKSTFKKDK